MKKLTANQVIARAGLKADRLYMHIFTGSVADGNEWMQTIREAHKDDSCFTGDTRLVEVVEAATGEYVEA